MSGWRSKAGRSRSGSTSLALAVVAASTIAGVTMAGAASAPGRPATANTATAPAASASEASPPAGTTPMAASELYLLYRNKSWQWADGAGRMADEDRRFTAWVESDKGKSWAEGRWLVTDAGTMCLKADWHSAEGVFPGKTCFAHRIGDGTIYQRQVPDGAWYVFRHADGRADDEAKKLVSADLVTDHIDSLKPVRRPNQSPMKQQSRK